MRISTRIAITACLLLTYAPLLGAPDPGPPPTRDPLAMEARSAFLRRFLVLEKVRRGRAYGVRTLMAMWPDLPGRPAGTCAEISEALLASGWQVLLAPRNTVDLDQRLDPSGSVAYLARPLHADRDLDGQLMIGSAGPVKVWLNGRLVHADFGRRRHRRDRSAVPVHFQAGCNDLVIRVARGKRWRVSVRLADREGYHLAGVTPAPLPDPPWIAPLPPLVVAPGATMRVPVCPGDTGDWRAHPSADGGERCAAQFDPRVQWNARHLPRFAALRRDEGPVLVLSPGRHRHGVFPRGALIATRDGTMTRVPVPIVVARQEDLVVTEPFDALSECRYPLHMAVTDELGRQLDLARTASWVSSDPSVGRVGRGGIFEAERPGRTVLTGRYGGLEATIPIRVVTSRPARPYRRRVASISTLVAIYQDTSCPSCPDMARRAASLGRLFIYRNTHASLNLALDDVTIKGPMPRKGGSYFRGVAADLRKRGLNRRKPGIVAGLGKSEGPCYGSGQMFGAAAIHCSVLKPTFFVHEIQHTLDRVITENSDLPDMIYGHGYTDPSAFGMPIYPVAAGRGADWEATVLRYFDGYDRLAPPWNDTLLVVDSDGDGLADADSRLPADERRFGSNPLSRDSDRDGLDDLEEFQAGIYHGTDPRRADTDGDGFLDGEDPWPLYDMPGGGIIPYLPRTPTIDGRLAEAWPVLIRGFDTAGQCLNGLKSCDARGTLTVYAGWNEEGLHLAVAADARIHRVLIDLDGSGQDGPYLGGDFYALSARRSSRTLGVSTAFFPDRSRKVRPIPDGKVAFGRRRKRSTVEVTIPPEFGPGVGWDCRYLGKRCGTSFQPAPGRIIGLAIRVETARYAVTPFEREVFVPLVLGPIDKTGGLRRQHRR